MRITFYHLCGAVDEFYLLTTFNFGRLPQIGIVYKYHRLFVNHFLSTQRQIQVKDGKPEEYLLRWILCLINDSQPLNFAI